MANKFFPNGEPCAILEPSYQLEISKITECIIKIKSLSDTISTKIEGYQLEVWYTDTPNSDKQCLDNGAAFKM